MFHLCVFICVFFGFGIINFFERKNRSNGLQRREKNEKEKARDLLEAEPKLALIEDERSELTRIVEYSKSKYAAIHIIREEDLQKQIYKLVEENDHLVKENKHLGELGKILEFELHHLHDKHNLRSLYSSSVSLVERELGGLHKLSSSKIFTKSHGDEKKIKVLEIVNSGDQLLSQLMSEAADLDTENNITHQESDLATENSITQHELTLSSKQCFILPRCVRKFLPSLKQYCHKSLLNPSKRKKKKDIESIISKRGCSTPKRYKYSDVKSITDSFKHELGKGGFGSVYKGKLPDGRSVAVKVFKVSNGNDREFLNEVTSIPMTSHKNVITLLGYCDDGKNRALMYEYMSNGSLEKFIFNKLSSTQRHLGLEKLYDIALGIAQGLEYLHHDCNTTILHLDIKPHNILLDNKFCPKISDFGLAKLQTLEETNISTLEARGTIGYIAPEVFIKDFGQVSHKSDVYSYGMMILEMAGGRKNVEVGHSSDTYFPHWIYKHIKVDKELCLGDQITVEENEIARKMIIVGLWCIQQDPSQRPSISRAIGMLRGRIENLTIPPPPYLCSPPRSESNSSRIHV